MRILFNYEELGILGRGGDGGGGGGGDGAAQAAADFGIANQQSGGALSSGDEAYALGLLDAIFGGVIGWGVGKALDGAFAPPTNVNNNPSTVPDFTNSPFFNQGA